MSIVPEEPHPFDGQFEPAAEAVAKDNPHISLDKIAQASIAISLKRLADHLTGTDLRRDLVDALYDTAGQSR